GGKLLFQGGFQRGKFLVELAGRENLAADAGEMFAIAGLPLGHRQQSIDQLVLPDVWMVDAEVGKLLHPAVHRKRSECQIEIPRDKCKLVRFGRQVQVVVVPQTKEAVHAGQRRVGGNEAGDIVQIEVVADSLHKLDLVGNVDQPRQLD